MRTLGISIVASLGFALLAPRVAEACDYSPGVYGSVPATGGVLPADAAVFLLGADIALGDVTALVDGSPASLEAVPALEGEGPFSDRAVRIVPPPAPGQTVEIAGTGCIPALNCEPFAFTFTVTEPDTAAPAAATVVGFDVHRHSTGWLDPCSATGGTISYWVDLDFGASPAEPVRRVGVVEAVPAGDPDGPAIARQVFHDASGAVTGRFLFEAAALGGKEPPAALCFRVTATDASSNLAGAPAILCEPCHFRDAPTDEVAFEEPAWVEGEIVAGGACDGGGATGGPTTGGATETDGSGGETGGLAERGECGCAAGGAPGQLGLVVLAWLGRRRRRR